jgi:hypothetical protein
MKIWKNPIRINNVVLEKEEFDSWVGFFRKKESEIENNLRSISYQAALDEALFSFERSSEDNFKNLFGASIKISKVVRNKGENIYYRPAIINVSVD